MNEDKRRETRVLAEQIAAYSLDLLIHVYRGLRVLDKSDAGSGFSPDLQAMTEVIKALRALNEGMYVAKTREDDVERLLLEVVPLIAAIDLLDRITEFSSVDEVLRDLQANVRPRFSRLVGDIENLQGMLHASAGSILASERAAIENISKQEALERDAARWK